MAANPMQLVGRPKLAKSLPKALPRDAVQTLLETVAQDHGSKRQTDWAERDLAIILTALDAGVQRLCAMFRPSRHPQGPRIASFAGCGACAAEPAAPPQSSQADLDERFLADITAGGMLITDVRAAIEGAHETCAYLAEGHSEPQALAVAMRNNASLTRAMAITVVDVAIAIYCPTSG